jgi:hypothetical protein
MISQLGPNEIAMGHNEMMDAMKQLMLQEANKVAKMTEEKINKRNILMRGTQPKDVCCGTLTWQQISNDFKAVQVVREKQIFEYKRETDKEIRSLN